MQHIKDWLNKQISDQFSVHKDSLGVTDHSVGYQELGEASSEHLYNTEVNPVEVFIDGFYYGTLNGEYLKLCEIRNKLDGIDYALED